MSPNPGPLRILSSLFVLLVILDATVAIGAPQSSSTADDLQKAHSELERGNAEGAFVILNRLAEKQPRVNGIHRELGLAYYRVGQLEKARQEFEAAIKDDPDDKDAVQMEGFVLYRMGQNAAAIPYLERARQWMPGANADANYVIGLCYLKARQYDNARAAFAAQYRLPPNSASAYLLLGNMLRQAHEPDDAAQQAREALKLSPRLPLAHFLLGEIASSKSDPDLAIQEYEAERDVNPTYAPIYDRLGGAYLRLNRLEQAQQALIGSIALDRTNTEAFVKMGKVLLAKEEFGAAIMYLRVALKMDPEDFVTHELLAQAYRRAGRDEEAKQEAEAAAKLHVESQAKAGVAE